MKKFLILFIFLTSFVFTQEVINIGEYELSVPNDYFDLKNAYIIMTNLYLEAEDNLSESLDNNKTLQEEYDVVYDITLTQQDTIDALTTRIDDKLLPNIEVLEKRITDLSKELKEFMKTEIISLSPMLTYKHNNPDGIYSLPTIGIGINTIILEKFNIGIYYNLDITFSVSVGYTIFKY